MKVLITGSTGMVGKGVLLECLDSERVASVVVLNRSSVGVSHPKLTEHLTQDIASLNGLESELPGIDACFFCLGISAVGLKEEAYTAITHGIALSVAQKLHAANPDSTFCFVSGAGTDSSEKGRMMWARVKGRTENDLLKLGFRQALMFRPGFIQPMRGIRSRTGWYNAMYAIIKPLYAILKHFPASATSTVNLGRAMIEAADNGFPETILGNKQINELANRYNAATQP